MKRFTFAINSGNNIYKLEEPLQTTPQSIMQVRNLDIFWNFKNVKTNTIVNYNSDYTLSPGYWTFEDLKSWLKKIDVELTLNPHDSTCTVFGEDYKVKLGELTPLLGLVKDPKTTSPNTVNVHLGVRFLVLTCNLVSFSRNYYNGSEAKLSLWFR